MFTFEDRQYRMVWIMENNDFVAYFDVSKAFDMVRTGVLFSQLCELGIVGRIWRLLHLFCK